MKISGTEAMFQICARVMFLVAWRAATCAISCAITPANSASLSAARINPLST